MSGQTWTRVPLGTAQDGVSGNFRFDPTVAFDSNGNVYMAYGVGDGTQTTLVVGKSTNGGMTYSQFTNVATNVSIGVPGNDKWHLATGPDPFNPSLEHVYVAWTQNIPEAAGTDQRRQPLC